MKLNICMEAIKNNRLYLLTKQNPYKEGTMEWGLLQCLIDNLNTYVDNDFLPSNSLEKKEKYKLKHESEWLRYLADKKIQIDIDTWSYGRLPDYALSLAKMNGVVSLSANSYEQSSVASRYPLSLSNRELFMQRQAHDERARFAVFIEDGLYNPLDSFHFTNPLKTEGGRTYKELMQVLYQNDRLRKILRMPEISYDCKGFTLKFKYNTKGEDIHAYNINHFPMSPWSYPGSDETWLGLKSRGLFHHLGDSLGFIYAASQYGEVYLVGLDDFGDLIVLGHLGVNDAVKFPVLSKVSPMDFDYVYGVPKGESVVMSKQNYMTVNSQECRVNTLTNAQYSDNFWNNEVFIQMASRKCGLKSWSEIVQMIKDNSWSALNDNLTQDVQKLLAHELSVAEKNILRQHFNKIMNLPFVSNVQFNLAEKLANDQILSTQAKSTFSHLTDTIAVHLIAQVLQTNSLMERDKLRLVELFIDFVLDPNTKLCYEDLAMSKIFKTRVAAFKKVLEESPFIKMAQEMLNQSTLSEKVYNAASFFYKTTAHKVHCDIINPAQALELGFFNKNDGKKKPVTTVNIYDYVLASLIDKFRVQLGLDSVMTESLDNYISEKLSASINDKNNKALFNYWKSLDTKEFFVSEIRSMRNEYRIFIVDNKIAAATPCQRNTTPMNAWNNGRMDPRLANGHNAQELEYNQDTRDRVAKYTRFAREFIRRSKAKYPQARNYVLDVAWCEELDCVIPIEINSLTWSGAYQLNFHRVCAAVAGAPYRYETLFNSNENAEDNWMRFSIFNEKAIAIEKLKAHERQDISFTDNGMARTAKSGNYPQYAAYGSLNTPTIIHEDIPAQVFGRLDNEDKWYDDEEEEEDEDDELVLNSENVVAFLNSVGSKPNETYITHGTEPQQLELDLDN